MRHYDVPEQASGTPSNHTAEELREANATHHAQIAYVPTAERRRLRV
jgi:hypothetical protein